MYKQALYYGTEAKNVLLFFTDMFSLPISDNANGLLITLTMVLYYSSVNDSVTVSQNAQYKTKEVKRTCLLGQKDKFIIYTCVFPSVTCQKVLFEKGL